MIVKIKQKIKTMKDAILFPAGLDKDYDAACEKSFLKFLDNLYYALYGCFLISAVVVFYFFITHELNS
jgi:hypothetical protein